MSVRQRRLIRESRRRKLKISIWKSERIIWNLGVAPHILTRLKMPVNSQLKARPLYLQGRSCGTRIGALLGLGAGLDVLTNCKISCCCREIIPSFVNSKLMKYQHYSSSLMSHSTCCHTCYTIQLMHYSHFKTHSLLLLKPIKC
jgi:hypothetical protein